MIEQAVVVKHYGTDSILDKVKDAFNRKESQARTFSWEETAGLDQFHLGGIATTKQMAEILDIHPGMKVLDVGSGLGGPARLIADVYGCDVVGADLSEPFTEAAQYISSRSTGRGITEFKAVDALDMPFSDASFDRIYTQHVAMNIEDRESFYRQIQRVLKPGGKFAFFDAINGNGLPLHFPLPWSRAASGSYLWSDTQILASLSALDFEEIAWLDKTEEGLQWLSKQSFLPQNAAPSLSLTLAMGNDFPELAANYGRNLKEGRVKLLMGVLRKK